jgi:hypothetical protein
MPGRRHKDFHFVDVHVRERLRRGANGHELRAPGRRRRRQNLSANPQVRNRRETPVGRPSALLRSVSQGFHCLLPINFCGGPDKIVAQLKQCREQIGAGIVDLSFQIPGSEDPAEPMEALELFGKKVLPHIRDI